MSRPVYTVFYSLFIIGLFFGLSTVYQSCGQSDKAAKEDDSLADKIENVADSYTEDSFFEEDGDDGEQESEDIDDVSSDSYAETDAYSAPAANTSSRSSSTTTSYSQSSSSSSSPYVVVAGNYLLESNADQMVKNLKSSGYSGAEKVVFDLSQYYTVVAGRYSDRSIANSVSSELKGKGIDNYVLRRK